MARAATGRVEAELRGAKASRTRLVGEHVEERGDR